MASAPQAAALPMFYRDLMPLNSNDHADWSARATEKATWMVNQHAIPLTAEEFIQAQRNYVFLNNARLGLESSDLATEQAPDASKDYDTRVAEQQVAQLQKVQALAETRVAPLRVNLPTRGLRFSFVQALQTEPNKPLTIRLHARSERDRGWFRTAALSLGGFVLVWGLATVALALRNSARRARTAPMETP